LLGGISPIVFLEIVGVSQRAGLYMYGGLRWTRGGKGEVATITIFAWTSDNQKDDG